MLIPSDIFASIAQAKIVFPPFVNTLAKALAIISALGLLLMSGRANKNPVLRIALGAMTSIILPDGSVMYYLIHVC